MPASLRLAIQSVTVEVNPILPLLRVQGTYKSEAKERLVVVGGTGRLNLGNVPLPPTPFASGEVLRTNIEPEAEDSFNVDFWPDVDIIRRIDASATDSTVDVHLSLRFAYQGASNKIDYAYGNQAQAYFIKPRDWVKMLESFGVGLRWQATVSIPKGPLASPFADAEAHFKKAFEHMTTGDHPETLGSIRKALEQLWGHVGNDPQSPVKWSTNGAFAPGVIAKLDANNTQKPADQLYSAKLYLHVGSLWKLAHMGPHEGYVVTKPMAELCYSDALLVFSALGHAIATP